MPQPGPHDPVSLRPRPVPGPADPSPVLSRRPRGRRRHPRPPGRGPHGPERGDPAVARLYDSRKRILVTGGAGFLGSHLCDRLLGEATTSSASTTSSPARKRNIEHLLGPPALRADAPRRHASRSTSRSTRSTTWPARPRRSTTSTIRCRRPRPACTAPSTCSGWPSALKARIFQASTSRGLRRPDGASAARGLLGQRQPDRPALLLRRRQALRRDAVLRLPPPAQAATSRWRASSTPTARACTRTTAASSRTSSCRRCAAKPITHLRRRLADALVLLRRRPGRGLRAPDGHADEVTGPINLGNPGEFTIARTRRAGHRADRRAARHLTRHAAARRTIRTSAGPTSRWPSGAPGLGRRTSRSTRAWAETIGYFRDRLAEGGREAARRPEGPAALAGREPPPGRRAPSGAPSRPGPAPLAGPLPGSR